jgi:hypothetical protein
VINSFVDVLRKKIRDDMNNYADDCAGGACRTFEEYQKLCGVIQGLALAESHLIDLAKRAEESDDNDG